MPHSCALVSRSLYVALLVLLAAGFSGPARADQLARLSFELKVAGTESIRGLGQSREHAEGRFEERYELSVTLLSSGEPSSINTKDPAYLEKMMGIAAGGAHDADEAERYLDFYGHESCESHIRVVIQRELSGEFADVQGMVPYSVRRSADYGGSEMERMMACATHSLVLDLQDGVFYTDAVVIPEAMVRTVREVRGRATESSESRMGVLGEVGAWVAEQLRKAPSSGQRSATLPLVQSRSPAMSVGDYAGEAQVELSWRLEPL